MQARAAKDVEDDVAGGGAGTCIYSGRKAV